jgi:beta-glucanase (GH16 family)
MTARPYARTSTWGQRLIGDAALAFVTAACFAAPAAADSWRHDHEPPSAPSNLHAAGATASSITFAWTASTDNVAVTGYDVSVGLTSPVRVKTLGYTASGLACGTSVTVSVVALDRAGNRSIPATATAATSACPSTDKTPPSTPTGLAASAVTATGMTLTWTASKDDVAVAGYDVYQGSTRVDWTTGTSYTLTGLSCGTTYALFVDAFDAANNTSAKASVTATTAACPATSEPAPIAGLGYHQVFRDDFDTLNRSVWDNHIWYDAAPLPAWINFQYAQSGILHLVTSRNFLAGTASYPENTITTLTSGRTFQRGYFEARMKWTGGHGAWPAFWLLSYRHATNPAWPAVNPYCSQNGLPTAQCYSAELDVFEGQGSQPTSFYGTIHRNSSGSYGVRDQQNANNWQNVGLDLTADFHTYGMLWTATQITWYLDGRALMSAPVYDSTDQPMFMLLQMWTGGWTYNPDSTTPTNLETQVDDVQVWQR